MTKDKKIFKATDFEDFLAEELKDPEAKQLFDEFGLQLDIAYKINHERRAQKITQQALAEKLGVSISKMARLERANANFTVQTLSRAAKALSLELKISLSSSSRMRGSTA